MSTKVHARYEFASERAYEHRGEFSHRSVGAVGTPNVGLYPLRLEHN